MKRCYICRNTENLHDITITLTIDTFNHRKKELFLCSECYKDNVMGDPLSIANHIYEDHLYVQSLKFTCDMCKKIIPVNVHPRNFEIHYTQDNYHTGEPKEYIKNYIVCPSCQKKVIDIQKAFKDKEAVLGLKKHGLDFDTDYYMYNFFIKT